MVNPVLHRASVLNQANEVKVRMFDNPQPKGRPLDPFAPLTMKKLFLLL